MNVNVKAVQDELPAGLSRVLNILESTIKEDRSSSKKETTTSSVAAPALKATKKKESSG